LPLRIHKQKNLNENGLRSDFLFYLSNLHTQNAKNIPCVKFRKQI